MAPCYSNRGRVMWESQGTGGLMRVAIDFAGRRRPTQMGKPRTPARLAVITLCLAGAANAAEDIAFVAEHLPEVAMDNRYAALPLWGGATTFGAGFTDLSSGTLTLRGPMFEAAGSRDLHGFTLRAFAFYDSFSLTSGREHRPLDE